MPVTRFKNAATPEGGIAETGESMAKERKGSPVERICLVHQYRAIGRVVVCVIWLRAYRVPLAVLGRVV